MFIRARQELEKRLDSLRPNGLGGYGVEHVLDSRVRDCLTNGVGVHELVAEGAANRFPLKQLARRDKSTLPGTEALLDEARQAGCGAWTIFDRLTPVDFGAIDWTRHPITGARPSAAHWSRIRYTGGFGGGDVKFIWELNRHRWLLRLAQGYFLTGDESFAEAVLGLLDRWIDQNPPGRGINWTSSLEVAFRAITWCWVWNLTCRSRAWNDLRTARFLVALWHHARHIERFDSIHHSPNTHLTGEGLALVYVGFFFPELRYASRWVRRGRDILTSELDIQVFDDGMHYERSVGYHRYTAEFYLHYLLLADAFPLGVDDAFRRRVHDQIAAVYLLQRPDGTWPVIGDEDSGNTLPLAPLELEDASALLAVGGAYFDEERWMTAAVRGPAASAGWWLLNDDKWARLREAAASRDQGAQTMSGALESAGYFVGREHPARDSWWCLVDGGPHGGDATGHAHTDLGHVEIAKGGSHLVADSGCAAYTIDRELRDWSRSERAHACLVVEDAPLAEPSGPFSWRQLSPTPQCTWGETSDLWWCQIEYERGHQRGSLIHHRQVVLVRQYGVIVADWLTGHAPRELALHWPIGTPNHGVVGRENYLDVDGHRVVWFASSGVDLAASLQSAARSRGYARQSTGTLLRLGSASPSFPMTIATCFAAIGAALRLRKIDRELVLDIPRQGGAGLSLTLSPREVPAGSALSSTSLSGVPG